MYVHRRGHGQCLCRHRLATVRRLLVENDSVAVANSAAKTFHRLRRLINGGGGTEDSDRVQVVERDTTGRGEKGEDKCKRFAHVTW